MTINGVQHVRRSDLISSDAMYRTYQDLSRHQPDETESDKLITIVEGYKRSYRQRNEIRSYIPRHFETETL